VKARLNVLVSGGTGSGKTMLNICRVHSIDERIVTVEDSAEPQLQQPHGPAGTPAGEHHAAVR
jgi:pilus assembly protein CpaF